MGGGPNRSPFPPGSFQGQQPRGLLLPSHPRGAHLDSSPLIKIQETNPSSHAICSCSHTRVLAPGAPQVLMKAAGWGRRGPASSGQSRLHGASRSTSRGSETKDRGQGLPRTPASGGVADSRSCCLDLGTLEAHLRPESECRWLIREVTQVTSGGEQRSETD